MSTKQIRQVLTTYFNDEELDAFCFDYYRPIYYQFTTGMTQGKKVQLLLDHCDRQNHLPGLIDNITQERPKATDKLRKVIDTAFSTPFPVDETNEKSTYVVTSHYQKGGITAGVVNVEPQPRNLTSELQSQLMEILPDKSKTITVICVMGDGEAFYFATQIKDYLLSRGYDVTGVDQSLFSGPVRGLIFNPDNLEILIGTRE